MTQIEMTAAIRERIDKYRQSERHYLDQANGCAGAAQALAGLLTELEAQQGDEYHAEEA